MKKCNSILAIAAVALTSVFGFTSCDKNDDAFNQPVATPQPIVTEAPTPKPAVDTYLYAGVTDSQLKYVDITYTLSVDGVTKVVKQSDMNAVKDEQRLSEAKDLYYLYKGLIEENEIKYLEFHIGNAKEAKIESITYTALSEKADHEIAMCSGAQIKSGMEVLSSVEPECNHGITEVARFLEVVNKRSNK